MHAQPIDPRWTVQRHVRRGATFWLALHTGRRCPNPGRDLLQILENRAASPRAWIVHSAYQMPRDQALEMLASGAVNPREVVLLEETPPPLGSLPDASSAQIVTYDADRIILLTSTAAPGLLLVSEIYYPARRAYVDDVSVHVYVAAGALRAIALPAGEHRVELRYEPTSIAIGLALSLTTVMLLLLMIAWRGPRRVCT
jgi:hypothetical protein